MEKTYICEIPFDNVTMSEATALAKDALNKNACTTVVTPNAEIAYRAALDADFMKIICGADIILPDGAGIIKAAKILGVSLKEKVAGVEFGESVATLCESERAPIFILGGKGDTASIAAKNLAEKYPGLEIAGTHDGYFEKSGKESDDVINEINESGATVLFCCLGSPAQEIWANQNKEKLAHVKLLCCLGGSVDVYAGVAKRAPRIFIKTNLEWLYRLIKQPSRIGRMMSLPKYLIYVRKFRKSEEKQ